MSVLKLLIYVLKPSHHSQAVQEQRLSGDAASYPAGNRHCIFCEICYANGWLLASLVGHWRSHTPSALSGLHPAQATPFLSKQLNVKAAKGIHINSWPPMWCAEHFWSHVRKCSCGSLWHSCTDVWEPCLNIEIPMSQMRTSCRPPLTMNNASVYSVGVTSDMSTKQ